MKVLFIFISLIASIDAIELSCLDITQKIIYRDKIIDIFLHDIRDIGKDNINISFEKIIDKSYRTRDAEVTILGVPLSINDLRIGKIVADPEGTPWKIKKINKLGMVILEDDNKRQRFVILPFSNQKSRSYLAKITLPSKEHTIRIIVPGEDTEIHEQLIASLHKNLGELPQRHIESLKKIIINPQPNFEDAKTMAQADPFSTMYFFAREYSTQLQNNHYLTYSTTAHEMGHLISQYLYGKYVPPGWKDAIRLDNLMVSNYGNTSAAEDFAETVALYLQSYGGFTKELTLRKGYTHRFKLLDQIFAADRNKAQEVQRILRHYGWIIIPAAGGTLAITQEIIGDD